MGYCAAHPAGFTGRSSGRPGIIISGAPPAGGTRRIAFEGGAAENNRKAKYYKLTAAGRRQLEAETETWSLFTGAVELILKTSEWEDMAMLNKLRLRLRALFFKPKMEGELQAELEFHLGREI